MPKKIKKKKKKSENLRYFFSTYSCGSFKSELHHHFTNPPFMQVPKYKCKQSAPDLPKI